MTTDKLLTISIAAYNVQEYIGKTLDSLMKADLRDQLDVVVVNDGSKDETSLIGHQYEMQYPGIVRVVDKENGGYGSTINISLDVALGKYYKLLDGDDWVDSMALDRLLSSLDGCNADVVVSPYRIVQEGTGVSTEVRPEGPYGTSPVPILEVMTGVAFPMHALAYRTDLLVDNNVRITEHCYYTDYEFTVKPLLYANTAVYIDANVYQYRIGRDGQSVSIDSVKRNVDMAITTSLNLAAFYEDEVKLRLGDNLKQKLMLNQVASSTRNKYQILFLLDSPSEGKIKLFRYDRQLKSISADVYEKTVGSKRMRVVMRLLRIGNGILYPVVAFAVKRNFRQ